jgi:hypothetical protein
MRALATVALVAVLAAAAGVQAQTPSSTCMNLMTQLGDCQDIDQTYSCSSSCQAAVNALNGPNADCVTSSGMSQSSISQLATMCTCLPSMAGIMQNCPEEQNTCPANCKSAVESFMQSSNFQTCVNAMGISPSDQAQMKSICGISGSASTVGTAAVAAAAVASVFLF